MKTLEEFEGILVQRSIDADLIEELEEALKPGDPILAKLKTPRFETFQEVADFRAAFLKQETQIKAQILSELQGQDW